MNNLVNAVILAAGKSTRFKGQPSKLLAEICGQEMIVYPAKAVAKLGIHAIVVVNENAAPIKNALIKNNVSDVIFATQTEQKGTGHAVAISRAYWDKPLVLVINGDMPLISSDVIQELVDSHIKSNATVSITTSFSTAATGYGRVITENDRIKIVEEKDCTDEQRYSGKINAGLYLFSKDFLEQHIDHLNSENKAHEFYLTDLVEVASNNGMTVNTVSRSFDEVRGVNNLEELWAVEQIQRGKIIRRLMQHGVRFELAQNIHVDNNVEIGDGSFVGSGATIINKTMIGKNCRILAYSVLDNARIGDETTIHSHTVVKDCSIGKQCHIGPFANVRENTFIDDFVTVGNFVEVKRSTIEKGTKAKHLSYIADSSIGTKTNIGGGTIFCNYDGIKKHKTIIGNNVLIGASSALIAPINIGNNSIIGAGSTITDDVPAEALAISRARQVTKHEYLKQKAKTVRVKQREASL